MHIEFKDDRSFLRLIPLRYERERPLCEEDAKWIVFRCEIKQDDFLGTLNFSLFLNDIYDLRKTLNVIALKKENSFLFYDMEGWLSVKFKRIFNDAVVLEYSLKNPLMDDDALYSDEIVSNNEALLHAISDIDIVLKSFPLRKIDA